jgi:D-alanine-D-alanine ligase
MGWGVMLQSSTARSVRFRAKNVLSEAEILSGQISDLFSSLRLAVIFGGNKSTPDSVLYPAHNSRSWKSYEAVAEDIAASLRRTGFKHVETMPEDMNLGDRLRCGRIHMAWLNTGGVQGNNSAAHASSILEMLGVPYVGHDPLNATTLDNKHAFKREAVCAGIPTAAFTTWHMARGKFDPRINSRFVQAFGDYQGPFIVKPVSGRASLHVHVVDHRDQLPEIVDQIYRTTKNLVLIEKYLSGREFCVAVAGPTIARDGQLSEQGSPFSFGALERVLDPGERIFTSMDVKPITGARFKHVDAVAEPHIWNGLHRIARDVYMEFGLQSLIRIDIRSDENGDLFVLEANPKPDLKNASSGVTSLISAGLSETGLTYDDLVLSLISDRLLFLFRHSPDSARHILGLLNADVANYWLDAIEPQSPDEAKIVALQAIAAQMRAKDNRRPQQHP